MAKPSLEPVIPRPRGPVRVHELPKRTLGIPALRRYARGCRACPLWKDATQTVFGEGPDDARVVLIGEQPGHQEDLEGRPFVGPAGRMLDKALGELGLDRGELYVTNAVKHFKFEPRGKVRLHKRARLEEQRACRQWLQAEIDRLKPRRIVCLGAMAARAVFGPSFKLMAQRGVWHEIAPGVQAMATVHPSYLLRLRDSSDRHAAYAQFVADLKRLRDADG